MFTVKSMHIHLPTTPLPTHKHIITHIYYTRSNAIQMSLNLVQGQARQKEEQNFIS